MIPDDNTFNLSFEHNGKQFDLKSKFVRLGYIHQFHVQYENETLIIEFDEERNYRVLGSPGNEKAIELTLLQKIVSKIEILHSTYTERLFKRE